MPDSILRDVLAQLRTVEYYHRQTTVMSALRHDVYWMSGNTLLAFIPAGLALWLFAGQLGVRFPLAPPRHRVVRWLIIACIIAFLPNAPYIMTDLVHLATGFEVMGAKALVLAPLYVLVVTSALVAYALTLRLLMAPVVASGRERLVPLLLVTSHLACAVGIQLGRGQRLNSWWIVTRPQRVLDGLGHALTDPASQLFIVIVFLATAGGHLLADRVIVGSRLPDNVEALPHER